nr:hypothetical protein [Propionibacterium sp.]
MIPVPAGLDGLFPPAAPVLFVHAHPDDETLSTGALIAALTASGRPCFVLTATRGERGEVRAGVPADDLAALREDEWRRACAALGVAGHAFLGTPPARSAAPQRRYHDSGMVWLDAAETLAGPAPDAPGDALTSADPAEVTADVAAYARAVGARVLVTYDAAGGYGHPDHVFLHAPTRAAASGLGVGFVAVVSQPRTAGEPVAAPAAGARWFDLAAHREAVVRALAAYASQLRVDGADVVHVGGQREPIQLRIGVAAAR